MSDEIGFSSGKSPEIRIPHGGIDADSRGTGLGKHISRYSGRCNQTTTNIDPVFAHDVNISVETDYIRATMLGGPTLSLTQSAIDAIMHAAEVHTIHKILIDSRRQYAEPSIVDCFEFAEHIASRKPWLNFFVAVIVHGESRETAEFAEIVAKNRGITLKVFSHDTNALIWLRNSNIMESHG